MRAGAWGDAAMTAPLPSSHPVRRAPPPAGPTIGFITGVEGGAAWRTGAGPDRPRAGQA